MDERDRVEGIEVPGSRLEFETQFGSEAACRAYLERVRWPDGFVCPNPACGGRHAWVTARGLHRCTACGRQTSATAGTILAGTRKPLRDWFELLWLAVGEDGVSAVALQGALGLGSYQTAWAWLHKVRRAMAAVSPELLMGIVALDVVSLASVESSTRRSVQSPTRVAIALDVSDPETGRVRLSPVPNSDRVAVERFVAGAVAPTATIRTTVKLRPAVAALGYQLDPLTLRAGRDVSCVHLDVAGRRLDDWIVETHHGAVRHRQLGAYLAEFAFHFNEHSSPPRVRFERLLEAMLAAVPGSARSLVGGADA
ncbi:MAG: IS1595 family transposase [Isosphaeraceae bacterium]|nr:IS1595 family transposase [Isosphaeraceae bacterium]